MLTCHILGKDIKKGNLPSVGRTSVPGIAAMPQCLSSSKDIPSAWTLCSRGFLQALGLAPQRASA